MEVSFSQEIKSLALGEGNTFHGEGILAITKALLQSAAATLGASLHYPLRGAVTSKPIVHPLRASG